MLVYTLAREGRRAQAMVLARGLVSMLAQDLRESKVMHECYDPDNGKPLGSPSAGFLSWNVLAAKLLSNLEALIDPFQLE